MSSSPHSLCVLANEYLMANEARTLETAAEATDIEIPLVLVNKEPDPDIDPEKEARAVNERIGLATIRVLWDVLQQEQAWSLVLAEKKLAEQLGSETASTGRVHVEELDCLQDATVQYVEPIVDGNWRELPPETVELVGEQCDLAIRFGFGLLRGTILDEPEYGVLSFHPADIQEYRGLGVPQAWLDGRDRMGVTLQRLSDDIDAGEIIAYEEVDVSHCRTLWETYQTLYDVKAELLAVGIENLRDPATESTVVDSLGPYYTIERRYELSFACRTLLKNVAGHLQQVTGRNERGAAVPQTD